MTHHQNIDIIKKACIQANPSIMELGFGCRFFFKGNNNNECIALSSKEWKRLTFIISLPHLEPKIDSLNRKELIENNELEILGRPIRLADVLLAYSKKEGWPVLELAQIASMWSLTKDSLQEQSEETLSFLANLLK